MSPHPHVRVVARRLAASGKGPSARQAFWLCVGYAVIAAAMVLLLVALLIGLAVQHV